MINKTIVINLFGAPGAGKSTGAAYIFSKLKLQGINCELVTEFAKDKVYEESKEVFNNQLYIFAKQYFRISKLLGKVNVIVTDAPLYNSVIYNKNENIQPELMNLVSKIESTEYIPYNYLIVRDKKYIPIGRFQTEEESNELAIDIASFVRSQYSDMLIAKGNESGYTDIVTHIDFRMSSANIKW